MCYAGYHYDLNFLTIHGKSRFPGLFVWLRDGRRVAVQIPAGCLFIQAGKQLEWLTGGYVKAGMHEVSSAYLYVGLPEDSVVLGVKSQNDGAGQLELVQICCLTWHYCKWVAASAGTCLE